MLQKRLSSPAHPKLVLSRRELGTHNHVQHKHIDEYDDDEDNDNHSDYDSTTTTSSTNNNSSSNNNITNNKHDANYTNDTGGIVLPQNLSTPSSLGTTQTIPAGIWSRVGESHRTFVERHDRILELAVALSEATGRVTTDPVATAHTTTRT